MQPRLDQARAAVAEAERRLEDLVSGPRAREIDEARAALGGRREHAAHAGAGVHARRVAGRRSKLVSASELDRARATRDQARASRDSGARPRSGCCAKARAPSSSREARAAVERERAGLAQLESVRRALPGARAARRAGRGTAVQAGRAAAGRAPLVAVMLADGVPYARVYVPEPLRAAFHAGAEVSVTVDGVAGSLQRHACVTCRPRRRSRRTTR